MPPKKALQHPFTALQTPQTITPKVQENLLQRYSCVVLALRKTTMRRFSNIIPDLAKMIPVVDTTEPAGLMTNLNALPQNITKSQQPALGFIEPTEVQKRVTYTDCVSNLRETFSNVSLTILLTPGLSHSKHIHRKKIKDNPDGYERLVEKLKLQGLHTIEIPNKSLIQILSESIQHHRTIQSPAVSQAG